MKATEVSLKKEISEMESVYNSPSTDESIKKSLRPAIEKAKEALNKLLISNDKPAKNIQKPINKPGIGKKSATKKKPAQKSTEKQLETEIAAMRKVYDDPQTPKNVKDSLHTSIKNAEIKLAEAKEKENKAKEQTPDLNYTLKTKLKKTSTGNTGKKKTVIKHPSINKSIKDLLSTNNLKKAYSGSSKKSIQRDASRKAKQPGKRVTSHGTVYWESRSNRSDVNNKKYPYLEKGGIIYPDLSLLPEPIVNDQSEPGNDRKLLNQIDLVKVGFVELTENRRIEKSEDAEKVFRSFWNENAMNVSEHFNVLLLNQANKPIYIYQLSKGGVTATVADIEMVAAAAIKSLAKGVIIAHNHPSGNLQPSNADVNLTNELKKALALFNIKLLDSLIITKDSYYSLGDNGQILKKGGELLSSDEIAGKAQTFVSEFTKNPVKGFISTWDIGEDEQEGSPVAYVVEEDEISPGFFTINNAIAEPSGNLIFSSAVSHELFSSETEALETAYKMAMNKSYGTNPDFLSKGGHLKQSGLQGTYNIRLDRMHKAKPVGYRYTDEGAKRLGVSVNAKPSARHIEKFKDKLFKLKGVEHRYLYEETRSDKSDKTRLHPFLEDGGQLAVPVYFGSGDNLDVYGYKTKNFDVCGAASDMIIAAMDNVEGSFDPEDPMYDDIVKAIKAGAITLDQIFEVEKDIVLSNKKIDAQQFDLVILNVVECGKWNYKAVYRMDFKFLGKHILEISKHVNSEDVDLSDLEEQNNPSDFFDEDQQSFIYAEPYLKEIRDSIYHVMRKNGYTLNEDFTATDGGTNKLAPVVMVYEEEDESSKRHEIITLTYHDDTFTPVFTVEINKSDNKISLKDRDFEEVDQFSFSKGGILIDSIDQAVKEAVKTILEIKETGHLEEQDIKGVSDMYAMDLASHESKNDTKKYPRLYKKYREIVFDKVTTELKGEKYKSGGLVMNGMEKMSLLGIKSTDQFGDKYRNWINSVVKSNGLETYYGYKLSLMENQVLIIGKGGIVWVKINDYKEFPKHAEVYKVSSMSYEDGGQEKMKNTDKIGENYNLVYELPGDDVAYTFVAYGNTEEEAIDNFQESHPQAIILSSIKAYGTGGFAKKVKTISKKLEGKMVPIKYRKQYGKKYDKKEANTAAKKIAGSMLKKYGI